MTDTPTTPKKPKARIKLGHRRHSKKKLHIARRPPGTEPRNPRRPGTRETAG